MTLRSLDRRSSRCCATRRASSSVSASPLTALRKLRDADDADGFSRDAVAARWPSSAGPASWSPEEYGGAGLGYRRARARCWRRRAARWPRAAAVDGRCSARRCCLGGSDGAEGGASARRSSPGERIVRARALEEGTAPRAAPRRDARARRDGDGYRLTRREDVRARRPRRRRADRRRRAPRAARTSATGSRCSSCPATRPA